jgi:hypothetical protein
MPTNGSDGVDDVTDGATLSSEGDEPASPPSELHDEARMNAVTVRKATLHVGLLL